MRVARLSLLLAQSVRGALELRLELANVSARLLQLESARHLRLLQRVRVLQRRREVLHLAAQLLLERPLQKRDLPRLRLDLLLVHVQFRYIPVWKS